jgi:hypothetical protein
MDTKQTKTRKVNVIAFTDETSWRVGVNLPDIDRRATKVLTPDQAIELSEHLKGIRNYRHMSAAARGAVDFIRYNVADDLLPEVAKQLHQIGIMARYNGEMARMFDVPEPANRNPDYVM